MAWLSNIVLYNLIRFERTTQSRFTYPFLLIARNEKVKNLYVKRGGKKGENLEKEVVKALENQEVGVIAILSKSHFIVLFFLTTFGIVNFVSGYLRTEFNLKLAHFLLMAIFSYGLSYWYSFRQDRYLKYFKEFETLSKNKKRGYALMTFFIVLGIWSFAIVSFVFLNYRL